jgi:catechol 2,3-dioxygenase-like lactoylglutathione lyase family enzyme
MSGPVVELEHAFLTFSASREDDARHFYGELLGLDEIERPEGLAASPGLWFKCGDQELHLGSDTDHVPPDRPHPGFRVAGPAELGALAERLEAAGVDVTWDERIAGVPRFYTRDPFGNRLELLAKT